MKVVSVKQSLEESMLFFLCFCLTSHRLPPLLAESRVIFFFFWPSLWCLSMVWHPSLDKETRRGEEKPSEEKKKRKKDRNAARLQSQILTKPLFSTHRLRYATMHGKYNEEWLNQTERKQIWAGYSFLFLLFFPHFAACNLSSLCFLSFSIPFPRLNSVLQSYSLISFSSICIPWGS